MGSINPALTGCNGLRGRAERRLAADAVNIVDELVDIFVGGDLGRVHGPKQWL
jgi:hypothetical protein